MSDLEITYCPHCRRPVTINKVISDEADADVEVGGHVVEQSPDEGELEDYIAPTTAKRKRRRIGFKQP